MEQKEEIKKLTDYEHVRLRTEMYFGSRDPISMEVLIYDENFKPIIREETWIPALFTYYREIFDNALDEIVGFSSGDKIIFNLSFDNGIPVFEIEDNGRGIPIDKEIEGRPLPEMVFSNARTGRNFSERNNVVGTNGIGAAATNFCSEFFHVSTQRDNKKYYQEFRESGEGFNNLIIGKPKTREISSDKSFTRIHFKPSKKVFHSFTISEDFIKSRIIDSALSNPKVTFLYNGEKIKFPEKTEKILFPEFETIPFEIEEEGFYSKFILVPNFLNEGEFYHTIVNGIPAFNGGVHVEAFKKFFFSGILESLKRESKRRNLQPNKSDISEKLLVFNITRCKSPNFDSQSKTRLVNSEYFSTVKNFLNEKFFQNFVKKNPAFVEEIYKRCAERTDQKNKSETEKAFKKLVKKKIPKLIDACNSNRKETILFLAEGDSAIAGLVGVRNPKIHAGMPLRGKIMNVRGEDPKRILENKELSDITSAINLIPNKKANRNDLRFGKVFIAHDADPDGWNIGALLVNFFYSFWPELFDPKDPFLYIFLTPYIIAEKGKERKYWYSFNYNEFKPEDWKGWQITRAKGLGSLSKEDWRYSLENPVVFPIVEDEKLSFVLDLIFNDQKADERKLWIANQLTF